jgi:hypothetical protein
MSARLAVRVLAAALVAIACIGGLALPAVAQAASDARLLAKFQPVFKFDESERFHPTSIDGFVEDAVLEQMVAPGVWEIIDPEPTPETLPTGTGIWRLNERFCSPVTGLAAETCYANANANPPSVVYGRVWRGAERNVVQYWLWYDDDFYSYEYPPSDYIWQTHEGDWELVNVVTSAADDEPLEAAYSQHCTGERRAWSDTPRRRQHPVVHVAAGSHANYFATGEHQIATACIPATALYILLANGLSIPKDHVHDGGGVAGPAALGIEPMAVVPLEESATWLAFPGFWGEGEYFHAPPEFSPLLPPSGTVPSGPSPVGPALHTAWADPLGTIAGWPTS